MLYYWILQLVKDKEAGSESGLGEEIGPKQQFYVMKLFFRSRRRWNRMFGLLEKAGKTLLS